ncbi:lipid II flippase MurJ [Enterobacter pasteurii]|uniref:lipid II flippase MurJ n=1 Tax=Enterobacter pasteurii TaxID=3029761 RepID=UPI00237FE642|nr:lipid II flippase MurJ [Enterobacter pasteurii]MDE4082913.1 lipid II flippase MurJ [Enterobacter pasteurii]
MNFIIYLVLSLVSKVFASAREFGIGYFWGAGALVDAFIIAMMLPMFFIDISNVLFNSTYINVFIKHNAKGRKDLFKDVMFFLAGYIVLSVLVIFAFLKVYVHYADIPLVTKNIIKDITYYILIYYSLMVCCELYKAHMVASEKQRLMPLPMIFANFIFIISMYFVAGEKNNLALVLCFVLSAAIQYLLYVGLVFFCVKDINKKGADKQSAILLTRKESRGLFLKNIIPVAFNSVLTQSSKITDKLIASGLLIGSLSSLYFAQQFYALYINIIIVSVLTFAYPKICRKSSENSEMANYVNDVIILLIALLTLPLVIGWYYSNSIFTLLLNNTSPDKIALASEMFNWLSIAVYFEAVSATIKRAFWAMDRMKVTVYNSAFSILLNIFLSVFLSKFIGVSGLVISYCISNFAASVLLAKLYYKDYGVSLDVKKIKVLIIIFLTALLLFFILNCFAININQPEGFIIPIIITLIGFGFYLAIIIKNKLLKVLTA